MMKSLCHEPRHTDRSTALAIRQRLDAILNRSDSPYVFTMEDGARFNSSRFCKIWKKGVDAAGITYVTSYSARHSFAAFSLLVGLNTLG